MHWHEPTQINVARRTAEGKTKPKIMHCLKRHPARQIYRALPTTPLQDQPADQRKNLAPAA